MPNASRPEKPGGRSDLQRRRSQTYRVMPSDAITTEDPSQGVYCQQLPPELGECWSRRQVVQDDLLLIRSQYHPRGELQEITQNPHDRAMLVITFGLEGESGYCGTDGSRLGFRQGFTSVTTFRFSDGARHYRAGEKVSQLRLAVGERTLTQYLGAETTRQLLSHDRLRPLACSPFRPECAQALSALSRPPSRMGRIEQHIHVLTLLSAQLNVLLPSRRQGESTLTDDRLAKLEKVKCLMQENMAHPLTIASLCALAGLNESQLKEGCHALWQVTPGQLLHGIRMRSARQMLETGMQVAQVAYRVGYRFPNNFSVAFTRFYGRSPKSVFGQRGA